MQRYGKTLKRDRIFPIFYKFASKINEDMKYYEVKFHVQTSSELFQDARDIVAALAGEAGFETFEETEDGLTGYVQQSVFDRPMLEQMLETFPLPDSIVTFEVAEAEDRDWNEQWEQEGFEPIVVDERCVIHDGRHDGGLNLENYKIQIEIDAKLAFGTGTHETTRMMVGSLLDMSPNGKRVLDCGTGTGILSIAALKLGAAQAMGYDIDEWSVENARHNAIINRVDHRFKAMLGDASVLEGISEKYDFVLANINRNILMADMPRFRQVISPRGQLVISGFYQSDATLLIDKARQLGFTLSREKQEGEWACLTFATD